MRKSPMFLGLIISIFILIFSIIIYRFYIDNDNYFLLDNPTEKKCKVIINGSEYILAPKQTVQISNLKKENSIKAFLNDSLILKDTFFSIHSFKKGVINPTNSDYYIFNRFYGYVKNKDSLINSKSIKIDSVNYLGDIKKAKGIIITDFYLNIGQNYPQVIKKQDSMIGIPKIFRKNQFIEFYNEITH